MDIKKIFSILILFCLSSLHCMQPVDRKSNNNGNHTISNFLNSLKYLFKFNEDINLKDRYGNTPLLNLVNNYKFFMMQIRTEENIEQAGIISNRKCPEKNYKIPYDKVKLLLKMGADVDFQDENGYTPLMMATISGQKEIVELLLEYKANVNIQNKYKQTSIMLAISCGYLEIFYLLFGARADINICDYYQRTPLFFAVESCQKEIVKLLLDFKVDVNAYARNFETPLQIAAEGGNLEIAQLLIKAGADPNILEDKGYNKEPLIVNLVNSFIDSNSSMIELLIKAGARVNGESNGGLSALKWAIIKNNSYLIKLLIRYGADVISCKNFKSGSLYINQKEREPKSILDLAYFSGSEEIIKIIKSRILEISHLKKEIFMAIKIGDFDKIKMIAQNVSLGLYDENGNNPLHIAILSANEENNLDFLENRLRIIGLILKSRKKLIDEKNNQSLTPVNLAIIAGNNNFKILKKFIELDKN